MRHTRDYRPGRPVAYFALHRKGFIVPPASRTTRWALTPPFHYDLAIAPKERRRGYLFSVTLSVDMP